MKSIAIYIMTLCFIATLTYGSDWPYLKQHNDRDFQIIQWYKPTSYHTPEAWKTLKAINDPTITPEEEKLSHLRAVKRCFPDLSVWTPLPNFIRFEGSYCSTGSTTPEIINEETIHKNKFLTKSAQKEMKKAQFCLENIEDKIEQNIIEIEQRIKYHKKSNFRDDYEYTDGINIIEAQRRLTIFSELLNNNKKRKYNEK